jgi:hypothetical protein
MIQTLRSPWKSHARCFQMSSFIRLFLPMCVPIIISLFSYLGATCGWSPPPSPPPWKMPAFRSITTANSERSYERKKDQARLLSRHDDTATFQVTTPLSTQLYKSLSPCLVLCSLFISNMAVHVVHSAVWNKKLMTSPHILCFKRDFLISSGVQ